MNLSFVWRLRWWFSWWCLYMVMNLRFNSQPCLAYYLLKLLLLLYSLLRLQMGNRLISLFFLLLRLLSSCPCFGDDLAKCCFFHQGVLTLYLCFLNSLLLLFHFLNCRVRTLNYFSQGFFFLNCSLWLYRSLFDERTGRSFHLILFSFEFLSICPSKTYYSVKFFLGNCWFTLKSTFWSSKRFSSFLQSFESLLFSSLLFSIRKHFLGFKFRLGCGRSCCVWSSCKTCWGFGWSKFSRLF